MKISLIIPCYNESKNLPSLFERCRQLDSDVFEVIIVNNGSTDDTSNVISHLLNHQYPFIKSIKVETDLYSVMSVRLFKVHIYINF
jgi:glycosyltransferase involved in cell wall biosynthesis